MLQITELERIIIQKEQPSPRNKLVMTGRGKKKGARTYYVMESDKVSLEILARLRNVSVKSLLK